MHRFAVYVEVDDHLTEEVLGNFVNATPGVTFASVFEVAADDTIPGLANVLNARRYHRRVAAAKAKDDALFAAGSVCMASVSSSYSYRSHRCEKPAKTVREVHSGDHALRSWDIGPNPAIPVCGIHARSGYLHRYSPEV